MKPGVGWAADVRLGERRVTDYFEKQPSISGTLSGPWACLNRNSGL